MGNLLMRILNGRILIDAKKRKQAKAKPPRPKPKPKPKPKTMMDKVRKRQKELDSIPKG
jgi:hypothetical protein